MTNGQNHHTYYQPSDPRMAGYFGRENIGAKPNISNEEFKQLLEDIDAGDGGSLYEVIGNYSFDPTQQKLLQRRNVQVN